MEDREHWSVKGSLNYDTVLQLEVPYVWLFISLQDIPDLGPKGTDLGVKLSVPSSPLTLPLYLGFPTEQAENQDTLPGGVASV